MSFRPPRENQEIKRLVLFRISTNPLSMPMETHHYVSHSGFLMSIMFPMLTF